MAFGRKPDDRQAVQEHRHGCGSLDRLRNSVGRVLQAQVLLAVIMHHFDGPAVRKYGKNLARRKIDVGAEEDSSRPITDGVLGEHEAK